MPKHPRSQSAQGLCFSSFFSGVNSVTNASLEGCEKASGEALSADLSESEPNNKVDGGNTTITGLSAKDGKADDLINPVFKPQSLVEDRIHQASDIDSLSNSMGMLALEPGATYAKSAESLKSFQFSFTLAKADGDEPEHAKITRNCKGKKSVKWEEEDLLTWGSVGSAPKRHCKGKEESSAKIVSDVEANVAPHGILKPVSSFTPDEAELHRELENPGNLEKIIQDYMPKLSRIHDSFLRSQIVDFLREYQRRKQDQEAQGGKGSDANGAADSDGEQENTNTSSAQQSGYTWDSSIYRTTWQGRQSPYRPTNLKSIGVGCRFRFRKWGGLAPIGVEWKEWDKALNRAHSYWYRVSGARKAGADPKKTDRFMDWVLRSGAVRDKALSSCHKRGYITKDYVDDSY